MALRGQRVLIVIAVTTALCFAGLAARSREPAPLSVAAMQLDEFEASGPCSAGRWPVKTLTDSAASTVSLRPVSSSVASLGAMSRPAGITDSARRLAAETTTATVTAALYADHLEIDRDIHVVLKDPQTGAQMIAEFPDPRCTGAAAPPLQSLMSRARNAYVEACGPASAGSGDYHVRATAQVTGVELFDTLVGQFGRAPNAIELHPVTGFDVTGTCQKFGSPTSFGVTSSLTEGATVGGTIQWSATAQASHVSAMVFAIDNVPTRTFASGSSQTVAVDTRSLTDGPHSFSVTATLSDGSTSILVDHLQTSNGVAPPAPPAVRLSTSRVRGGGNIVVEARSFPRGAALRVTASRLNRRWLTTNATTGSGGAARITLHFRKSLPRGSYALTVCANGCDSIVTHPIVVG